MEHKFQIINERVSLVDLPGIDDGFLAPQVSGYIERKIERSVPVILIHLTIGGFEQNHYFKNFQAQMKYCRVFPTIIFTKFENLLNDLNIIIKDQEEE